MLCGFTVGEYIRQRRLAQAASEFISSQEKVIDIALKYGYDSPRRIYVKNNSCFYLGDFPMRWCDAKLYAINK